MIYLDNAATTFPKPDAVISAVTDCMQNRCGNPGRGSHTMAQRASEVLFECREAAASFFGLDSSDGVVFTLNATHALNAAIFGLINDGDHVLISDLEHNSVLRPVEYLRRTRGVEYDVFATDGDVCAAIRAMLRPNTKAVICTHASNIVNRVLPAASIGRFCKSRGLLFILDASQSAGSIDINMRRDNISVLCTAGHKGLLGPQGCGLALFSEGVTPRPFMHGGSGINSLEPVMPEFLPDRLEAGTCATPAIAGLLYGIRYVRTRGAENIRRCETHLSDILHSRLEKDGRFDVYSKRGGGLFLFNIKGMSSAMAAEEFNRQGVCVRSGLHCAPLAHKSIGTPEGGAVRASVGPFTTEKEIQSFCSIASYIAGRI